MTIRTIITLSVPVDLAYNDGSNPPPNHIWAHAVSNLSEFLRRDCGDENIQEYVDVVDRYDVNGDLYQRITAPENAVVCSLCKMACDGNKAHKHQGEWIGDECCWDERLRNSE